MVHMSHRSLLCLLCLRVVVAVLCCVGTAHAGVVLGGTRLVYPAGAREVTLGLENRGTRAALVQAWIDDGDDASTPGNARSPFLLTPPIFRMEAKQSQVLRILYTGESLPGDRESLFWLNVFDVPPKAKEGDSRNLLQFAFRNRIKVFYRPKGLPGEPSTASNHLRWTLQHRDARLYLEVENPSPYHISLPTIELAHGQARLQRIDRGAAMLAPMSSSTFEFETGANAAHPTHVHFATINDHGARKEGSAELDP